MATASNTATSVDQVMLIILGISVVLFVGIMGTMVFFVVKYSRKNQKTVTNISHHTGLELVWTIIPIFIVLVMFYYGFVGFKSMRTGPKDAFQVTVTGRMWSWLYTYPNGIQATDQLRIPMGEFVRFNLKSTDVIHSFYVPAFRVKWDAVPGRDTHYYVKADKPGTFDVQCAEYCGLQHAYMLSKVTVMPRDEFDKWYAANAPKKEPAAAASGATAEAEVSEAPEAAEAAPPGAPAGSEQAVAAPGTTPATPPVPAASTSAPAKPAQAAGAAAEGEKLAQKYLCMSCHSTDGSKIVGPSFKGLFGSSVTVVTDGKERTVKADDAYLLRSITDPNADLVKGYQPLMPAQPQITDDEARAIVAYIKSRK